MSKEITFTKSTAVKALGYYVNHWGLRQCETQRIHLTKAVVMTAQKPGIKPRACVRPYNMSISFSVRGACVAHNIVIIEAISLVNRNAGFNRVFAQRAAA